jgi:lipopolysaccharide heptosyltransferase II
MRKSVLNRDELAQRNIALAAAYHQTEFKYRARRLLLQSIAKIPFTSIPYPRGIAERILLIRPDHLGDVLLTTPAVHALREALPYAQLHMLVGTWSASVLVNYDEIDQVLTLPFPGFSRSPKPSLRSPYELAVSASRMLRRIGYTSAVILRPDHWWGAMLAHMAGIQHIIGYNTPDVEPFLTDGIELQRQHAVLQSLKLVEYWTGSVSQREIVYRFPVDERDTRYIEGYLSEWGVAPGTPLVCIHPGSGAFVKQWDAEKWASVADTLVEQLDAQIVLTGSDSEIPLAQQIADHMKSQRACLIAGDTDIGQLAALFSLSKVVLGPDSGPLHLAVAAGAPTVTLYGPASPVEFGSWGNPNKHLMLMSDIACRPCGILNWSLDAPEYHPCVKEITVGRVLEAARRAMNYEETH